MTSEQVTRLVDYDLVTEELRTCHNVTGPFTVDDNAARDAQAIVLLTFKILVVRYSQAWPARYLIMGQSIRATWSIDPCRHLFRQIQTHGFLFLDDYLDNIVHRRSESKTYLQPCPEGVCDIYV